jgi:hypothetical protein
MFVKGERTMQKKWVTTFFIMVVLVLLPSAGCTGSLFKNYGSIVPDRAVTNAFEQYQVNPKYNYYISGSEVYPNAIIGLDKAYALEPDLWKPVEMTPQKLRELVQYMHDKVSTITFGLSLHGFAMFDDKGKQIGVWYSILEAKTSLKMKDERTVEIITPDIDTYLKYEDGRRLRIR